MLGPITVILALPIYKNWLILKKYWLPIIVSTIVGCVVSLTSVYLLGLLFDLDYTLIISLLPKSVTTAIAKEISVSIGAIPEITIAAVIFTGILGSLLGPLLSKIFKINDPVATGVSFGVSSHAIGTSKAIELSEEIGAISSIAIVTTGILTMIITLLL
jgi:putative effector of murein hydrolase